jgi:hypothetical protein
MGEAVRGPGGGPSGRWTVAGVTTRAGVSSLEALVGCLAAVLSRGNLAAAGHTVVGRRISEDYWEVLLLQ